MVFTTIWSYRYTRLGKQIADPARRPSDFEIRRAVWIGVAASAVGILFLMFVILFEVVQLLIYFPPSSPGRRTSDPDDRRWTGELGICGRRDESVALTLSLFGELIVLVFSIWLLFRSMMASTEFPYAGNVE